MSLYDYQCPKCHRVTEISHPMKQEDKVYYCPRCGQEMVRIWDFPHTELNWKAYDRNETGQERQVLRAAKPGKTSHLDDSTDRYAKAHDDVRQEGRYI